MKLLETGQVHQSSQLFDIGTESMEAESVDWMNRVFEFESGD